MNGKIKVGDKVKCCLTKDHFERGEFNCPMIVIAINKDGTYEVKMPLWNDECSIGMPKNYCKKV